MTLAAAATYVVPALIALLSIGAGLLLCAFLCALSLIAGFALAIGWAVCYIVLLFRGTA